MPSIRYAFLVLPVLAFLALMLGCKPRVSTPQPTSQPALSLSSRQLQPGFEQNRGQTDPRVSYLARGAGALMFLTPDEIVLSLLVSDSAQAPPRLTPVRMRLLASSTAQLWGEERRPGVAHFYRGSDASSWVRDVPSFARVRYEHVYPGIDLLVSLERGYPRYDFHLAPGANPDAIRIRFGTDGTPALLPDGSLQVRLRGGELRHSRPVLYQEVDGERVPVQGSFRLEGHDLAFRVGDYDVSRPLVIDPTITYSGLIGGSGAEATEFDLDIVTDGADKIYLAGSTLSADFPVTDDSEYQGNWDGYVMRLSASDPTLLVPEFASYLGGSGHDRARAVDRDAQGNAVVVGSTTSTNSGTPTGFPLVNALQTTLGGSRDGFLARLTPGGLLLQSTYVGGGQEDFAEGVDAASDGIYIVGWTRSPSFPFATSPILHGPSGNIGSFVLKLAPDGTAAEYLALLGGTENTHAWDVAASGGEAVVVGSTGAVDFPTVAPLYPCLNNHPNCLQSTIPNFDAFVTRLSADGQTLLFSTWIGGNSMDQAYGVEIDPTGGIVIAGSTYYDVNLAPPVPFPTTADALQQSSGGGRDGFVARLSSGGALEYGTYLGGSEQDEILDLAVDAAGRLVLTGTTRSGSAMLSTPPLATQYPGGDRDAFLLVLQPAGNALQVAQWFPVGGAQVEEGIGAAAGGDAAYVSGMTNSPDFWSSPAGGALNGLTDHFVVRVGAEPVPVGQLGVSVVAAPEPVRLGQDVTYTVVVSNTGTAAVQGVTAAGALLPDKVIEPQSVSSPDGACVLVDYSFQCDLGVLTSQGSATVTLVGRGEHLQPAQLEVTAQGAGQNPVTGSASSTLEPALEANLSLNEGVNPSFGIAGEPLSLEFEVKNSGPDIVPWVHVSTVVQGTATFVAANVLAQDGGSCARIAGISSVRVECNLLGLESGEPPTVVRIVVLPTANVAQILRANVELSGYHYDPTPENTLPLIVTIQP